MEMRATPIETAWLRAAASPMSWTWLSASILGRKLSSLN
jgi:hypothetical protein